MDVVSNWIAATEAQLNASPLNDMEEQAVIALYELASDQPFEAINVILQVLDKQPKLSVINCLGAGPLEELLVKHPELLNQVIGVAETNNALRQSLLHVNMPDDNVEGVNRLNDFLRRNER